VLKDRFWLIFGMLHHIGLALLPITLIARLSMTSEEKKAGKKVINWWYVAFGALFMLMVFARWGNPEYWDLKHIFPYYGSSITPEGFGPRKFTLALTTGHELDPAIRVIMTILSTGGGVILIWLMSRTVKLRKIDWRSPSTLAGLLGLAHIGLILLNPHFFDRYLLPLIPFAFIWLAPTLKNAPDKTRLGAWVLVFMYLGFSLAGTFDSHAFSKAKWDIALEAHEAGISPSSIVCGYEPDGYFNFTNEKYMEPPEYILQGAPWWISKLNLKITPEYVVVEQGSSVLADDSPWRSFQRTEIHNDRMVVYRYPR